MKKILSNRILWWWLAISATVVFYCLLLTKTIVLSTADLGRHIKNGEIIIQNIIHGQSLHGILYTNFYSYTITDSPFINHHWLSGVVYYLTWKVAGFSGTSILYLVISALTLLMLLAAVKKQVNWWLLFALAWFITPLAASRAEVRPEVFTYFFLSISFYILWKNYHRELSNRRLIVLPIMQLFWVNMHIGFIFGLFFIAVFGLVELVRMISKQSHHFYTYLNLGVATLLVSIINPSGIQGVLYPFMIFRQYGYRIVENQSISFLQNLHLTNGTHFGLYAAVLVVYLLSTIAAAAKKQFLQPQFWIVQIITITFAILAYLGIRNFPLFAYFAIPAIAINFCAWGDRDHKFGFINTAVSVACVAVVLGCFFSGVSQIKDRGRQFGVGTVLSVQTSADFFKTNNLKGPIFNNYDIGGYLIFNLFPQEKVFTDNRPEAYTKDFFDNTYIAAQEDANKFYELDKQYHFNCIYFAVTDLTPWGQQFIIDRVSDSKWTAVYVDSYAIIFMRNNELNKEVIGKFGIPKSNFVIRQNKF